MPLEMTKMEQLTGKAKVDFEQWLFNSFFIYPETFYSYPFDMKQGMYLRFFDTAKINIEIGIDYTLEPKYCHRIDGGNWSDLEYTRGKAVFYAIDKAYQIYNKTIK